MNEVVAKTAFVSKVRPCTYLRYSTYVLAWFPGLPNVQFLIDYTCTWSTQVIQQNWMLGIVSRARLSHMERVWSISHHHLVSNTPRISWCVNWVSDKLRHAVAFFGREEATYPRSTLDMQMTKKIKADTIYCYCISNYKCIMKEALQNYWHVYTYIKAIWYIPPLMYMHSNACTDIYGYFTRGPMRCLLGFVSSAKFKKKSQYASSYSS